MYCAPWLYAQTKGDANITAQVQLQVAYWLMLQFAVKLKRSYAEKAAVHFIWSVTLNSERIKIKCHMLHQLSSRMSHYKG